MTYYESSAHSVNDGALHVRFSDDYGDTWSDEDKNLAGGAVTGFPMNPPDAGAGEDAGEPWLMVAPNGDLLIHMWRVDYGVTANGTYQSRSEDGGLTWGTPAVVDFDGIADDAKVFSTDDNFVSGTVIYAGARQYDDAVPTNCRNIFIKSTDNGATWTYISDISSFTPDTIEVGLEYLGDNNVIAMLRDLAHTASYKAVSSDMGATWGALTNVTGTVGIAGRQRVYTLAHLRGEASWWTDTNLIMVGFVHQVSGNTWSRRNCYWTSADAGANWSGPNYIDAIGEDSGYGDIFYRPSDEKYVIVSNYGTSLEADLVQYVFEL